MSDTVPPTHPGSDAAAMKCLEKARWPLSYSLQRPGGSGTGRPAQRWWSHELYRGPQNEKVETLYCKTKAQSELVARQFVNEPILGFDMEWPWKVFNKHQGLQGKVSLIQIASESKIALFHLGMMRGTTTEDIIAPTLRRIIESPEIGKVGVHILVADFGRLSRFFGLKPQGAIESSHFYRLAKFGSHKPELVSVKLVSLAQQVEDQLGLPLFKGEVRTSDWSKPLSQDQIKYAASDAYAGFMLYHCTNAQRLAMKPTPPRPIYAEKYPPGTLASSTSPILLDAGDGTTISTEAFFGVKPVKSGTAAAKPVQQDQIPVLNTNKISQPLDTLAQALFEELVKRRAILAEGANVPAWRILSDKILGLLAQDRPSDTTALLAVKGVGKVQQKKYGDQWLEVISQFCTSNNIKPSSPNAPVTATTGVPVQQTPRPPRARRKASLASPFDFDTLPNRDIQLPTGVSFAMAEASLAVDDHDGNSSLSSDESLPSLNLDSPLREIKRKRIGSPTEYPTCEPCMSIPRKSNSTVTEEVLPIQPDQMAASKAQCPPPTTMASEDLSIESKIARNKLSAFSKLIARKLSSNLKGSPPIVSDHTLDLIIRRRPQTQHDLEQIPGIDGFLLACERSGTDLLKNVIKFTTPEK